MPAPILPPIAKGSPEYRRLTLAMLFAGFATFSLLYSVQPLLPVFAHDFALSAEGSSLAVSLATGPLAIGILFAGALSDRLGRRPMMVAAMFLAGLFTVATAFAPNWGVLLALRFATGLALAGVPAVAMAYVSEEVDTASVGSAIGLYIAGNALGGMAGRLGMSVIASVSDWRWALGIVGLAGLLMAEGFRRLAPESRGFVPAVRQRGDLWRSTRTVFADRALPWLYAAAFLLMGVFVTVYNYAGFRLKGAPYHLSDVAVGAIFLLYILGSASSAWFGGLANTRGRRTIFWIPVVLLIAGIVLTAAAPLVLVIGGIAVVTVGFFGAHSIASSWVGRRALGNRGHASALYLFFYYLGSSVLGSIGGIAWTRAGWPGVAAFCGVLGVGVLGIAAYLRGVPPLAVPEAPAVRMAGGD